MNEQEKYFKAENRNIYDKFLIINKFNANGKK